MKKSQGQIGALLLLLVAAVFAGPLARGQSSDKALDVLSSSNESFRSSYARARREITEKLSPLIYCNGEVLTLIKDGKKTTAGMVPPEYTMLKSVDHIALDAYIILTNHTDQELKPDTIQSLEELRKKAKEARAALESASLIEKLKQRQYAIIDATVEFISQVQKQGFVSASNLKKFASGQSQILMLNGADAVGAQLALMNKIVTRWKSEMSPDDWKRLRVIVTAGHMPRDRLVAWQFFSELLNQKREGESVIVMEGLDDLDKGIELLGTHMLDEKIAVDFFGDRWRMHKDLLSTGARQYLHGHRPGK